MDRICIICRRRGCYEHKKLLDNLYGKIYNFRRIGREFYGTSISPFIGSYNYPKLNAGILSSPEISDEAWIYDNPKFWFLNRYDIEKIIEIRSNLLNARRGLRISNIGNKFLEAVQEVAMAKKEVDSEFLLKKEPRVSILRDRLPPIISNASVEKIKIVGNVSIPSNIEKVVGDEIKATEAITFLYNKGIEVDKIQKLLSTGLLGLKNQRRIVPTRFSITAVDDILGKNLIDEIKNYNELDHFEIFEEKYLGNHYIIIFIPMEYSFELLEFRFPDRKWNINSIQIHQDYEDYFLRKKYAENTAGAFYAGRLACLEYLSKIKKQAGIIIIREIYPEYFFPVGIWQMREAVRGALSKKGYKLMNLRETLEFLNEKLAVDVNSIIIKSKLLGFKRKQKKLLSYTKSNLTPSGNFNNLF